MSYLSYSGRLWETARRISRARGGSAAVYYLDAARCAAVHGASPENYFVLRLFSVPESGRGAFLTSGRSKSADKALNAGASPRERTILADKYSFDAAFAGMNRRAFAAAPECTREEFDAFLRANETFIIKPRRGTQGMGVRKMRSADAGDIYALCAEKGLLLEETVRQHPALDGINPSCLNTLRINAAHDRHGRVRLIGAALRCGGVGADADNFHSGGVAYTVDTNTGRVCSAGRDNSTLALYLRHPGTLRYMPDFEIPNFDAALECVERAMAALPGMGYVGWDIAVTPDGAELIEGNFAYPGGNIIQFDGVGKYPALLDCIGDVHGK